MEAKVWWPKTPHPGNFGDILTPVLLKHLLDVDSIYTDRPFPTPTIMGVGSIISLADNNSIVWGSGFLDSNRPCSRSAKYLSVRGPRTYEILQRNRVACPEIFGDPALLMPLVYAPDAPEKEYKYGFFPHYVDYKNVHKWYTDTPDVTVINPLTDDPFKTIDHVLQCDKIISSSLHGIIIAHAYGIPAIWVTHSDKLDGNDIKFHDYYESVNLPAVRNYMYDRPSIDFLDLLVFRSEIDIDTNLILEAISAHFHK